MPPRDAGGRTQRTRACSRRQRFGAISALRDRAWRQKPTLIARLKVHRLRINAPHVLATTTSSTFAEPTSRSIIATITSVECPVRPAGVGERADCDRVVCQTSRPRPTDTHDEVPMTHAQWRFSCPPGFMHRIRSGKSFEMRGFPENGARQVLATAQAIPCMPPKLGDSATSWRNERRGTMSPRHGFFHRAAWRIPCAVCLQHPLTSSSVAAPLSTRRPECIVRPM